MNKIEAYREKLRGMGEPEEYLLAESGLPGPRGNLELAAAAAAEVDPERLRRWRELGPEAAPTGTAEEFLAFCGVLGLGREAAAGARPALDELRRWANDPRWRLREAVAMALQRLGEADMDRLLDEVGRWAAEGSALERRAAIAGPAEPRLLGEARHARRLLDLLDGITAWLAGQTERKDEGFAALRKGLGYCWSVAVAALPEEGKARMERWLDSPDPDVRWVMKENLKKKRLERMDAGWVEEVRGRGGRG